MSSGKRSYARLASAWAGKLGAQDSVGENDAEGVEGKTTSAPRSTCN